MKAHVPEILGQLLRCILVAGEDQFEGILESQFGSINLSCGEQKPHCFR
jgi:hypothetical protein